MAKGKKNTNKKKKGANKNRLRDNGDANVNSIQTSDAPSTESLLRGIFPDFKDFSDRLSSDDSQGRFSTIYSRYKGATQRVINYILDNVPDNLMDDFRDDENKDKRNNQTVDYLTYATDWLIEQKHMIDPSILKDLELAIRMRTKVAKSMFGGGDMGHMYFIQVLTYCWTNLVLLPRMAPPMSMKNTRSNQQDESRTNTFDILAEEYEDVEEEAELDEEIFPSSPIPRPEPQEKPMSIQELMAASDRIDATMFLLTLDELMGSIVDQYRALSNSAKLYRENHFPESAIVENIIEAAVATNMAIQQVQQIEMELHNQHEHLSTPYRLLAVIVFPEFTAKVAGIMREHASHKCCEKDISVFLGDCMECCFRNTSDSLNKTDSMVQDFCQTYNVDETGSDEIQLIFKGIQTWCVMEVPFLPERKNYKNTLLSRTIQSHSWLQKSQFIGGKRSIHHTIRLLQTFGQVIRELPEDRKLIPKRDFFGPPWVPGRSHKIHGDLDELLMSDILPQYILMCRKGFWSIQDLPYQNELAAFFGLMREYIHHPGKPVSWSIAFAVHAMLTAILETDGVSNYLVSASKSTFNEYFEHLKWAVKIAKNEEEIVQLKVWNQNTFMISFLENMGLPVFGDRAIWNPLCGGTALSYLAFFGNLDGGCAVVDCKAQLRIVLHLFHALLINGIVKEGEIPMLDKLYNAFKSSKAVWEGELPSKGECVKKFWICFGMSPREARTMSDLAKKQVYSARPLPLPENVTFARGRKLKNIEPSEIATCFRRICKRDFHDVQDNYHTPEQVRRMKETDIYKHAVRSNDTLDAIEREQWLLHIHLPACAAILEQFVCSITRILQWENALTTEKMRKLGDKRQGFAILFAQHLLGALDFANDPAGHEFLNVPMGHATYTFMEIFFNNVSPTKLLWFAEVQEGGA